MELQRLLSIQSQRGAKRTVSEISQKPLESVIIECRTFIKDRASNYRNMEAEERRNKIKELILNYTMSTKNLSVEGFTAEDGRLDTNRLVDTLVDNIQNCGRLTYALDAPDIYEIRGNGKEIKIERAGRCCDLTDEDGNIVSFESPEEQETILRKLLGDVRLSAKDAVINARTLEGYRLAVIHSSAIGDDPSQPGAPKYHAFVLRKFNKIKMNLGDIARKGTMSDNMARFLACAVSGGLTFFTCGPTASGKSTTNNAILQYVPYDTRVILLQNPSEIDLRFKDPSGRVVNDVLHLEYIDKENPGPHDPTSENLMDQILRFSPTFVACGEWRSNKEFKLGMKIVQAGHPVNSTLHAEDSEGAVGRINTAVLSESGNIPADVCLLEITSNIHLIIIQKIMRDGIRRVLQITEVLGVQDTNHNKPLLNDLYRLVTDGDPIYGSSGRVEKIPCHHERVGKLSQKILSKFSIEAIPRYKYDFLTEEVNVPAEIETYTGDNIRDYNGKEELKKIEDSEREKESFEDFENSGDFEEEKEKVVRDLG